MLEISILYLVLGNFSSRNSPFCKHDTIIRLKSSLLLLLLVTKVVALKDVSSLFLVARANI